MCRNKINLLVARTVRSRLRQRASGMLLRRLRLHLRQAQGLQDRLPDQVRERDQGDVQPCRAETRLHYRHTPGLQERHTTC